MICFVSVTFGVCLRESIKEPFWAVLKWCCLHFMHYAGSSSWLNCHRDAGQSSKGMNLAEVSNFVCLPVYLLACCITAGLYWMDKLPDNRLLTIPLHHFGINSRSRRACLTVAVTCIIKYNRQSPNILQQTEFMFCSRFSESCEMLMW